MKILVLHNSENYRTTLQTLLQCWGHEVVLAADGQEAQKILEDEDAPRLAILDAMMPGMGGCELCERIRAQQKSYIYVIILGTDERLSSVYRAYESGADDFICNAFDNGGVKLRLRVAERILASQQALLDAREALRFEASHDPLVKLWNRKAILNLLAIELSRAKRMHSPMSIFFADLDHFKHVNDLHGHLIGDEVLRNAAGRMSGGLREYDHLGRYGGEEFLAVLPNCDVEAARDVAERVRRSLAERPVLTRPSSVEITTSIGVSEWRAGLELPELLERADTALYRAKNGGRNRVEVEDGRQPEAPAYGEAEEPPAYKAPEPMQMPPPSSMPSKRWTHTRQKRRWAMERDLEVITRSHGAPELIFGRIRDISEHGLGAVIAHALEIDEKVTLHFNMEEGNECTVAATVRHCKGSNIGFEFMFIERSLRDAISKVYEEAPGRRKGEPGGKD